MMILVKCNKCGKDQKYHTKDKFLSDKRKQCVYCGKSFKVREQMVKRLV